jgi:redox-sensitive bicupin YhaK (pirin superfamily)
VIAGRLGGVAPPSPPPHSWASHPDGDVAIWSIRLQRGARWTLPAAREGTNRGLYFFRGKSATIDGRALDHHAGMRLRGDVVIDIEAGPDDVELLLLQGKPIGEPVVQYGPFVMNSPAEIEQAFADYRRTQFGGWPWPTDDPVHGRDPARFARHADGRIEHEADPNTSGAVASTS